MWVKYEEIYYEKAKEYFGRISDRGMEEEIEKYSIQGNLKEKFKDERIRN